LEKAVRAIATCSGRALFMAITPVGRGIGDLSGEIASATIAVVVS